LKAAIGDHRKLIVDCETELMANAYRDALDVDIAVAPGPSMVNTSHAAQRRMASGRPNVMCVGHANTPKGYDLLPGSIERVLRARPNVSFRIHGMHGHLDAERNTTVFETLTRIGPQVEVDTRILTTEEYIQLLQQADLLLLPYDPLVYRARGSGVFNEATALGIPMVVTSACGFARSAFDEQRAIPIESYDCDGVAEAIVRALDVLPSLTERASSVSQRMGSSDGTNQVLAELITAILEGPYRRAGQQRVLHRQ
jgi:glycosyltransferase involved in cell wall biosynthesis